MDNQYWQHQRAKRSSISAGTSYSGHQPPGIGVGGAPGASGAYAAYGDNYSGYLQQAQIRAQAQAAHAMLNSPSNTQTERSSYYETHYPLYHCEWSHLTDVEVQNIAVSTYREDSLNKLQVLHAFPNYDKEALDEADEDDIVMEGVPNLNGKKGALQGFNLYKVSESNVNYPVTNLQWDPSMLTGKSNTERLATSSECLRVYEVETDTNTGESSLVEKLTLTNSRNKNFNQLPPLTSFDWNKVDPNEIITGSIDTTCTLWDLTKGSASMAKTQLIAHDSEVFDVKFLHGSKYLFSSCGNDGSIRVFDLRSLEHSTIVYEPQLSSVTAGTTQTYTKPQSLLRIAASNNNVNHVAAIEADSNKILVLDLRYPGTPIKVLDHHSAPINSIKWHPSKNLLLSGADDCQALIYDLSNLENAKPAVSSTGNANGNHSPSSSPSRDLPVASYEESLEINNVCWGPDGDWIGVVSGKGFQIVKVAE